MPKSAKAPNPPEGLPDIPSGFGKPLVRAAYALWLFDPSRQPKTQKEFARLHGVNAATLSEWKHTAPEVIAAAKLFRERSAVPFAEAVAVQLAKARRGSTNAFRAVAQVLGESALKIEADVTMSLASFLGSAGALTSNDEQTPRKALSAPQGPNAQEDR